ncbi:kinase-like domain-containing protein [Nemania sp. NC0429]|nr:kinase-like domain-containing protein [Nemania sp. NC0429]
MLDLFLDDAGIVLASKFNKSQAFGIGSVVWKCCYTRHAIFRDRINIHVLEAHKKQVLHFSRRFKGIFALGIRSPSPHNPCRAGVPTRVAETRQNPLTSLVELEDAHLGSLPGFSRSTSLIADDQKERADQPVPSASNDTALQGASVLTSDTSTRTPVVTTPRPGIIVVSLYEARRLSLPRQYQNVFSSRNSGDSMSCRLGRYTTWNGKLQVGVDFEEHEASKLGVSDFEFLEAIGKGRFGRVMLVRKKDTNRPYALKSIRKASIIARSEVTHTLAERSVLAQINNPFIVPLKFVFQSPEKLYLVQAFVNGGGLFYRLKQEGRFDVDRSRFYAAELLCALESLHRFNVIYRDLKPENILRDYQDQAILHSVTLDLLGSKLEMKTKTRLALLVYEMPTGLPPFCEENTNKMHRKILSDPLTFPSDEIVPPAAKDPLTKLLNRDPSARLGANGSAEIKSHPFFHAIDWRKVLQRKYEPAFKPNVNGAFDTTNINLKFTSKAPQDYPNDLVFSQMIQEQFTGFSYNRPASGLNDGGDSIRDLSATEGLGD